jgi:hypothetical protein
MRSSWLVACLEQRFLWLGGTGVVYLQADPPELSRTHVVRAPGDNRGIATRRRAMNLLLLLIILLLLFGGGGFYWGGPRVGGSLGGIILLILIILLLTGRL